MVGHDYSLNAGLVLRRLINEKYPSQEAFAIEFGADIRTINRYINQGINKISTIQELAFVLNVDTKEFLTVEE